MEESLALLPLYPYVRCYYDNRVEDDEESAYAWYVKKQVICDAGTVVDRLPSREAGMGFIWRKKDKEKQRAQTVRALVHIQTTCVLP
jgi:hypothetical protein